MDVEKIKQFIENIPPEKILFDLFVTCPVLAFAFSLSVRKIIGKRDNWTCQDPDCDKKFQNGFMVHAAHLPEHHSKDDPIYDTPEAGRILCIWHHLLDHINGTSLGRKGDDWAVSQLENTDHRTRKWRKENRS